VLFSREGYAAVRSRRRAARESVVSAPPTTTSPTSERLASPDRRLGKAMPCSGVLRSHQDALDGHPRRAARDFLKKSLAQLDAALLLSGDPRKPMRSGRPHRYEGASPPDHRLADRMMLSGSKRGSCARSARPSRPRSYCITDGVRADESSPRTSPEQRRDHRRLTEMIVAT